VLGGPADSGFLFGGVPTADLGVFPLLLSSIWMVKVTAYVSTTLALANNYLSWRTEFASFVILSQLDGMLDGAIPPPTQLLVGTGVPRANIG